MKILTWPNLLTLIRFIIAFCLLGFAWSGFTGYSAQLWALGGFVAGSVTDWLDGYIARTDPAQSSELGKVLDPIADKQLVATYAVYLWSAGIADGWFELICFGLILFRETAVMILRTARGPSAVPVSKYGKWKTGFQMSALVLYGLNPLFPDLPHTLAPVVLLIAFALTYWSWVQYLTPSEKDAVEV